MITANTTTSNVATPFGGIEIKTNDTVVAQGLGLPAYPDAELQENEGDYNGDADVDMRRLDPSNSST
ncbi:hypothetical protein [Granulicella sp. S190]|uniref:hypothetical protein n=1 Tax=Granulicella sp. S190 TaxID=1747226 RepID=UPI00131CB656|nr:hypothetical protein [Granulicella sp. S190]